MTTLTRQNEMAKKRTQINWAMHATRTQTENHHNATEGQNNSKGGAHFGQKQQGRAITIA
jgi:hypothetical protein